MRLTIADHKRIMYWFHLAFKRKEPSNGDKRTMTIIQNIARIMQTHELNEEYDDKELGSYKK